MNDWRKFAILLREEASHWADGCQAQMAMIAIAKVADQMDKPRKTEKPYEPKSPIVYSDGNYRVEEQANGRYGIFNKGGGSIGGLYTYLCEARAEVTRLNRQDKELGIET